MGPRSRHKPERTSREENEAELEDLTAAKAVGQRAREHEQAGDDEGVSVHDPLQVRERGVEIVLDGG